MSSRLNKEQAAFLLGAALFGWAVLKFVLFMADRPAVPTTPKVNVPAIHHGDAEIRAKLAIPSLGHYAARGARDPFFDDASQPATLFVRSTISHNLAAAGTVSHFTFDCRMTPNPIRELRFRLPPGTSAASVHSKERDPRRRYGQDGRILVVPVDPTRIKRTYYRCQVAIVIRGTFGNLPTQWQVPVISCTAAMDKQASVAAEVGTFAVVTPSDHVELTLITTANRTDLQAIVGNAIPKPLASKYTKFVYHFAQPDYELVFRVQRTAKQLVAAPKPIPKPNGLPKPKTMPKPKDMPRPKELPQPKPRPQPKEKLDIPPPPKDTLPLKLVAIIEIEAPEPRRQAILRHKDSGEYYRQFVGDTFLNNLRLDRITDDAVILTDAKGKKHKLRGRFEDKYND